MTDINQRQQNIIDYINEGSYFTTLAKHFHALVNRAKPDHIHKQLQTIKSDLEFLHANFRIVKK